MLPNFIFIGPGRAGTTWLYKNLKANSSIELARNIKEVNFFNWNYHKGLLWYSSFWTKDSAVRGEISNLYIYDLEVAHRIITDLKDIKIITVLRHPLDRCISSYLFKRRSGEIDGNISFTTAMSEGLYKESLYSKLLEPYFRNEIKMYIGWYEDLSNRPDHLMKEISDFIGVNYKPESISRKKINSTVIPRNIFVTYWVKRIAAYFRENEWFMVLDRLKTNKLLRRLLFKEAEKKELVLLTQTEREDLISRYFLKDIKELEDRLNISLDQWKI